MNRWRILFPLITAALVGVIALLCAGCEITCSVGETSATEPATTTSGSLPSISTASSLPSTSASSIVPSTATSQPPASVAQQTTTTSTTPTTSSTAGVTTPSLVFTGPTIDVQLVGMWTRFDETDLRLKWEGTWATFMRPQAYGGSFHRTAIDDPGIAKIKFEGTGVRVIGGMARSGGLAKVTLDYAVYWVDFYADFNDHVSKIVWTSPALTDGLHELMIELTDQDLHNWPNVISLYVDAVEVVGTLVD